MRAAPCAMLAAMSLVDLISVLAGLALFGACLHVYYRCQGRARGMLALAIVLLALAFGLHRWPGFPSWTLVQQVALSRCSQPVQWTLHLDKAAAGLMLLLWAGRGLWAPGQGSHAMRRCGQLLVACMALLALGCVLGFVRWNPAPPPWWPAWLGANIMLTVVAEEVLFRGFMQRELERAWQAYQHGATAAWLLVALLFGAAHLGGGPVYAVLATLAGLLYGWLWQSSRSLLWPIAAHALLNASHFLLFTWPAWNGRPC